MSTTRRSNHWRKRRALAVVVMALPLLAAWIGCTGVSARADDLYSAQTIVTGQAEPNRRGGFAACLEDVLIKVSGAAKLAGDARLRSYKAKADSYVKAYRYHDQMSGTPTHDEQGTRDRPYDLLVDFDAAKIDALLDALGLQPWRSHRPVLVPLVEMEQGARSYIVTSDGRQSDLQRDALLAAASMRGMNIVLPSTASLAKAGVTDAEPAGIPPTNLSSIVATLGGEVALIGHLTWSDQDLGWITKWRIDWQGHTFRWQLRGVTFDESFRRGIGDATQVLSGNEAASSR